MSTSEIERVAMNFGSDLADLYYYTAQSFIGQEDGGIADHFDGNGDFKNGIGREILITLAAISGNDEFDRKSDYIWKRRQADFIEAKANDPSELTAEQIEQISPMIAEKFLYRLETIFQVNHLTLVNRFQNPLTAEVERYLTAEMAFAQAAAPAI
jgi:hypothetical protein